MKLRSLKHFLVAILIAICCSNTSSAVTKIRVTKGSSDPIPFYLHRVEVEEGNFSSLPSQMRDVIIADLESSGLFEYVAPSQIEQGTASYHGEPDFAVWRYHGITAVVTAKLESDGSNGVKLAFRVWDVVSRTLIRQHEFSDKDSNWRYLAHKAADQIHFALTGDIGYFNSKIVYVSETGTLKKRIKRIAMMDQDGANHRFLTQGNYLVLTPRFSPSMNKIVYLSYANRNKPRLYMRDLRTGKEFLVGEFPGMTFTPRFSPDGEKMLMSMAYRGNTNIYEMDLKTMKTRRITSGPAIETSPSYSPDGKEIVFVSDVTGRPQLYIMSTKGGEARRISFGKGIYSTPSWSPRGDYIAFTKHGFDGSFYIGLMRPDGSGERLITRGYMVENPSWSPNGRRIIYTRQEPASRNGQVKSRLHSIDLTGLHETEIPTPLEASDAFWSPLIQ